MNKETIRWAVLRMKALIFFSVIITFSPFYGAFDMVKDLGLEIHIIQSACNNGQISSKKCIDLRKEFVSRVHAQYKSMTLENRQHIIYCATLCKAISLAQKSTAPLFISMKTLEQLLPSILTQKILEQTKNSRSNSFLKAGSLSPELTNILIYKYGVLNAVCPSFSEDAKVYLFNGAISTLNLFRKDKEKIKNFNQSLCKGLVADFQLRGFFIGKNMYKGSRLAQGMSAQTPSSRVRALKVVLKPALYGSLKLEDFSGDLKKRIINFLLCLRRQAQKNPLLKLPRMVVNNCIFLDNLCLYEVAQRIKPILLDDIALSKKSRFSDGVGGAMDFLHNSFEEWFDKKAMR